MAKILALIVVLFVMLLDWNEAFAFEMPKVSSNIFGSSFPSSFPSTNFPFPTKTPKPTDAPSPSSTPAPTATPKPQVFEISDIEPSSANFMEEFVIYGGKFGSSQGAVNFRYYTQNYTSASAVIISWSDSEIHAKVPALKKGSYRIQVVTADGRKTEEERFSIKNGQPVINSTSVRSINGNYELTFGGVELGKKGKVNIYSGGNIVAQGIIKYWSSSKIRFELPSLSKSQYGFEIEAADGRKANILYFNVGN